MQTHFILQKPPARLKVAATLPTDQEVAEEAGPSDVKDNSSTRKVRSSPIMLKEYPATSSHKTSLTQIMPGEYPKDSPRPASLTQFMPRENLADSPRPTNESWIPFTDRVGMLLQLDHIPPWHNLLASLFSWLLLAGYMVLPGTFASLRNSQSLKDNAGRAGKVVLKTVDNIPILWVGAICCLIGISGMSCLSWIWRRNYEWLINRIIMPGLLHSSAGLLTTLVNIYTARGGVWSVTAVITAVVTGSCSISMLTLYVIYYWLLAKIKKTHEVKMEAERHARGNGQH